MALRHLQNSHIDCGKPAETIPQSYAFYACAFSPAEAL